MRHKTLFSMIVLCGSTAALANLAPMQTETPLQNNLANEISPPGDAEANETLTNATDVEPTDPTDNGTETVPPPNSTY